MLTGGPCRFLQKLYKNVTVKVGAFDIQSRPAIVWKDRNKNKRVATYRDLLSDSQQLAKQIIDIKKSVGKRGIGYIENDNYISNGRIIGLDEGKYNYVKALFASFLSSSAFVPLGTFLYFYYDATQFYTLLFFTFEDFLYIFIFFRSYILLFFLLIIFIIIYVIINFIREIRDKIIILITI